MNYSFKKTLFCSFQEAIEKVTHSLKNEGFGVLTTIDMQLAFQKKLDKNIEEYIILGACHPQSAYTALKEDKNIGVFLPCNVVIYRENNETHVSIVKPSVAMSFLDTPDVKKLMLRIESSLQRVIDSL